MSTRRSAASLKQWLQLRQTLSATTPSTINPPTRNLPTSTKLTSVATTSNDTATSTRSFHSTRASLAAARPLRRAPGTIDREKRARHEAEASQRLGENGNLFLKSSVQNRTKKSMGECLQIHEQVAGPVYDNAVASDELPEGISFNTYQDIGAKLIMAAFENNVSAAAVRAISVDVDAVFRIGHFVALPLEEPIINEWILSSCAMAKARVPLILTVHRSMKQPGALPSSQWTAEIQKLSQEGYPPAMLLQAQILGRRGNYDAAFRILEKRILTRVTPTRKRPSMFASIELAESLASPHRTYALLRASHDQHFDSPESRQKADEAIRVAAMEYNDPKALAEYASVMMNENNLDMYEECMCKAATAGYKRAAFYLGNFYYLTFLGQYPTRGERTGSASANKWPPAWMSRLTGLDNPEKPPSFLGKSINYLASFLNQSLPQKDYRRLAADWYSIALQQGHRHAAYMVALLMREDATTASQREDAGIIFEMARSGDRDPELMKLLAELEENWFNPDYEPTLPKKFLAVR